MQAVIHWNILTSTGNAFKANLLAGKLSQLAGIEMHVSSAERYWKDKSLYQVVASSSVTAASSGEAVLRTLGACSKIARSWNMAGPTVDEAGEIELGATAGPGTILVPGIEWISYNVEKIAVPEHVAEDRLATQSI